MKHLKLRGIKNMMGIKEDQLLWYTSFFGKKSQRSGINIALESNERLANELYQAVIRKFEIRKVCSSFRDNIWAVDLADMQLLSNFNKGFRFLLWVIDIFSKYAQVIPLKFGFQKIINDSKRKPDKIQFDKGGEFYDNSFKKWLKDNDIVMYSTNNEGKSVIAETFIKTLKNKIDKYMNSI